jgi:hypothetical protein
MGDISYKYIDGNYIDDTYMINNGTTYNYETNPVVSICAILIIICSSLCCSYQSGEYFISDFINRTNEQRTNEQRPSRGRSSINDQLKEYIFDNTTIDDDGLDCCICLDKFVENGESVVLKCNHRFHTNCIINWFEQELTCPLCRRNTDIC